MKKLVEYEQGEKIPERRWVANPLQFRQYAEVSGDFNPIHLDDHYARQLGLKGVIAHGMLTMTQLGVMLTDWVGQEGLITRFEVRFEGMVYGGQEITFSGVVRGKEKTALVCDLQAVNEEGERVLSGWAEISLNH